MNRFRNSILFIGVLGLLSACLPFLFFQTEFKAAREKIQNRSGILVEYQELLTRKDSLESEWENKKIYFQSIPPEEALSTWQKELMASAQSLSLVIDKLEPLGLKGDEISVFLSFKGDMKKMDRFIYHLMESDPLSKVKSFSVRQEEGGKNLLFEVMLAKGIK